MKCDWTQKVSLLIDGELAGGEEARAVERHLAACGDCQQAQADFLSLRQEIAAYQIERDAFAEHRALKRILAAGASGAKFKAEDSIAKPRRRFESAGMFGMPRLSPAGLAALLLLVVGIAIGIVSLLNVRRAPSEMATTVPTPAAAAADNNTNDGSTRNTQSALPATANNSTTGNKHVGESLAGNQQREATAESAKGVSRSVTGARNRERAGRIESAGNKFPKLTPPPMIDRRQVAVVPLTEAARNTSETVENNRAVEMNEDALRQAIEGAEVTATSKTERHVEQAQLLLRSFRNARPSESGNRASSDIAYDKRQSKKLLYQNIVLRREAASRGNLPVESLLDSLEPILIDIANLPDKPAPADMREINERMRRKNLVAMLQISSVESASARN